jgi:dCMP deaminase
MKKQVKKTKEQILAIPTKQYIRPSWDEYFMNIAQIVGTRGTCDRGRSGCVIVRDHRILVTGYVGSPAGLPHCDHDGHEMSKLIDDDGRQSEHCIRTIHAEQNAIAQAAQIGIAINNSTLYCKMTPCYTCAKLIINAGIKRVVAEMDYHAAEKTKEVFKEAKIILDILHHTIEKYDRQ